jgi:hypothetical protein
MHFHPGQRRLPEVYEAQVPQLLHGIFFKMKYLGSTQFHRALIKLKTSAGVGPGMGSLQLIKASS